MLAMLCQGSVMLSIPTFKTVLLAVTGLYRRSLPRGAPAGAQGREYRSSDRAGFSSPMGDEVYGERPCGLSTYLSIDRWWVYAERRPMLSTPLYTCKAPKA